MDSHALDTCVNIQKSSTFGKCHLTECVATNKQYNQASVSLKRLKTQGIDNIEDGTKGEDTPWEQDDRNMTGSGNIRE